VGKIVAYCLKNKKGLDNLTLNEYQEFYKDFTADIKNIIKLGKAVNSRKHIGGTAPAAVLKRINEFEKNLHKT
jgi:argininosuccinate lyase